MQDIMSVEQFEAAAKAIKKDLSIHNDLQASRKRVEEERVASKARMAELKRQGQILEDNREARIDAIVKSMQVPRDSNGVRKDPAQQFTKEQLKDMRRNDPAEYKKRQKEILEFYQQRQQQQ